MLLFSFSLFTVMLIATRPQALGVVHKKEQAGKLRGIATLDAAAAPKGKQIIR